MEGFGLRLASQRKVPAKEDTNGSLVIGIQKRQPNNW